MRIFSEDQYLYGEFPHSSQAVRDGLRQFITQGVVPLLGKGVVGGMPFGAVVREDANLASAASYLVLLEDSSCLPDLRRSADKVLNNLHVLVTPCPVIKDGAAYTAGVSPLFFAHASAVRALYGLQGVVGLDPLAFLKPADASSDTALMTSLIDRFGYLAATPGQIGSVCKEVLSTPFLVARLALSSVRANDASLASCQKVAHEYHQVFGADGLDDLLSLRQDYRSLLQERVEKGMHDLTAYHNLLYTVCGASGRAYDFCLRTLSFVEK